MTLESLNIDYDRPKNWHKDALWKLKTFRMWKNMWCRVTDPSNISYSNYKDCKIHDKFRIFSNFLKWLEKEPRFEEFCSTCHEVRWCIDKDIKCPGNRNYYPEFMTLTTQSENCRDRNSRFNYSNSNHAKKSIIGVSLKDNSMIVFDAISHTVQSGFHSSNIIACLKGDRKSHKGYKWFYIDLTEL